MKTVQEFLNEAKEPPKNKMPKNLIKDLDKALNSKEMKKMDLKDDEDVVFIQTIAKSVQKLVNEYKKNKLDGMYLNHIDFLNDKLHAILVNIKDEPNMKASYKEMISIQTVVDDWFYTAKKNSKK